VSIKCRCTVSFDPQCKVLHSRQNEEIMQTRSPILHLQSSWHSFSYDERLPTAHSTRCWKSCNNMNKFVLTLKEFYISFVHDQLRYMRWEWVTHTKSMLNLSLILLLSNDSNSWRTSMSSFVAMDLTTMVWHTST
jgi:hypothetical protein